MSRTQKIRNNNKNNMVQYNIRHLLIVITLSFLSCMPVSLSAQVSEDNLKVLILDKIIQYISWPEQTDIADTTKSMVIGVLGKDPFGECLQKFYDDENRTLKNKNVDIHIIENYDDIYDCHILFISETERSRLHEILKLIQGKPIMLVGDTKNFGAMGVDINFFVKNKKIRFELNEKVAVSKGLVVDFRLRSIAKIVGAKSGVKR